MRGTEQHSSYPTVSFINQVEERFSRLKVKWQTLSKLYWTSVKRQLLNPNENFPSWKKKRMFQSVNTFARDCFVSHVSLPEVLFSIMLFANGLVVLEFLKHHRTPACRGGTILGLRRSQRTLTDLDLRQKAHQSGASLFPHREHVW